MKKLLIALIGLGMCFAGPAVHAEAKSFEDNVFIKLETIVPLKSSYGNTEVSLRLYCYFDGERYKHTLFNYKITGVSDELAYAKILYAVGLIGSNAIRETPSVNGHDDSLIGLALKTFLPGQGCPKKPTIANVRHLSATRVGAAKSNDEKFLRLKPLY